MMRTRNPRLDGGHAGVLAFVLAIWTFLSLAPATRAQVDPAPPVDEAAFEARYAQQTLRVSLWLNKGQDEIYRRGEPLSVTFQTNEDAYAVLYHIDVEGRVSMLWPTSRYSDGFVFGGHQYRLPSRQGERMRVGGEPGQGFIQAVVSAYPFDLRDVELDFHHEPVVDPFDFYVAGDPYLAMNEVNFVVTGLEDPSEFAVSNHVAYYVHEEVDHPRYLCFQCHDTGDFRDPYRDTCTINVQYDYSWHNDWWDRYSYYPVYHYPVYVYVDPWAGVRWTNYWYHPWYRWPWSPWHSWSYATYSWHHSPYWSHDVYVAQKHTERRYRPLDRDLVRQRERSVTRTKSELVRGGRPTDDRLRAIEERRKITTADARKPGTGERERIRGAGGKLDRRVDREPREQERFEPRTTTRTSPGLRLDADRTSRVGRSTTARPGDAPRVRADDRPRTRTPQNRPESRVTPRARRGDDSPRVSPRTSPRRGDDGDRRTIRPVQPRNDRDRVWSNRRSSGSSNNRPSSPPSTRSARPKPRKQESVRPNTNRGSSSPRTVRPSPPPKKPSRSTPPPSRPKRGGGGSSRSKSSGGRG